MKLMFTNGNKIVSIACLAIILLCGAYFILFRIPIKRSVNIEDVIGQECVWIVKRVSGPPEYVVIGDGTGLFMDVSDNSTSVYLDGMAPPKGFGTALNDYENIYVCKMEEEYTTISSADIGSIYTVLEWKPFGLIKRDSVFPDFFYSPNYLCIVDLFTRSANWIP